MVEKKQSGFSRKEVAWRLSHRPAAARGPHPCARARLLDRGPAPNPPLPGDPAPLPSLHTQAPSTGEQAMALSQEQRALQSTP